ncbi:transcription initiation factor IID, 18kD subunit-domain-containing protein [Auriculariales sp. MPI-PUGE-AT-0066]|nr:transcription initiation factor IID, 18kD subunit-domain-containing protein [Auriculariales sp. MPI-PUGE-AT-0066]
MPHNGLPPQVPPFFAGPIPGFPGFPHGPPPPGAAGTPVPFPPGAVPFPPGWHPPSFAMPPGGFPFPFPPPHPGHQTPTPYRQLQPTPGASGSATPVGIAVAPPSAPPPPPPQASSRGSRKPHAFKNTFVKELKPMMFGFGDEYHTASDSAALLEEILIEYVLNVCDTASDNGRKSRLALEDLRAALSHPADAAKLARVDELIFMQGEIKKARSEFKDDLEGNTA